MKSNLFIKKEIEYLLVDWFVYCNKYTTHQKNSVKKNIIFESNLSDFSLLSTSSVIHFSKYNVTLYHLITL